MVFGHIESLFDGLRPSRRSIVLGREDILLGQEDILLGQEHILLGQEEQFLFFYFVFDVNKHETVNIV